MNRNIKVLIADNDDLNCDFLKCLFVRYGIKEVAMVNSPAAALYELMVSQEYDLLISHVYFNEGNGLALTKQIRAQPELKKLKIILMSAHPVPDDAINAGADAYFEKPVDLRRLRETIATYFP